MIKTLNKPIWWIVAGAVAVGLSTVVLLIVLRPKSPIPASIKTQLNFPVFYPEQATGYKIDPESLSYDSQTKVLIFSASKPAQAKLTFSEQVTPDPFNDISGYYDKFVEKLGGYSAFDSENGKVTLTHPQELKGGQSAVMNSKGTLMFVHPDRDVSTDQWRQIFNALKVGR